MVALLRELTFQGEKDYFHPELRLERAWQVPDPVGKGCSGGLPGRGIGGLSFEDRDQVQDGGGREEKERARKGQEAPGRRN